MFTSLAAGCAAPQSDGVDVPRTAAAPPVPADAGAPVQSEVLEAYRRGDELYQTGRYAEAEPFWREGLERAERELGPDHPGTAGMLNSLASLYHAQGRYAEAEPLHRRALTIR